MTTTSRRLSLAMRGNKKGSSTPGRTKNLNCQKQPLKTFGCHARPWKLSGQGAKQYSRWCALADSLNK